MLFEPIQINIGDVKLNNVDHSSTVSFGSVIEFNKNVAAKKSQGIGQQLADCSLRIATKSMVLDDDMSDGFNEKKDKGGI